MEDNKYNICENITLKNMIETLEIDSKDLLTLHNITINNSVKEIDVKSEVSTEFILSVLDNLMLKIDNVMQSLFKNVTDYFATTRIVIESVVDYETKTPSIKELYKNLAKFYSLKKEIRWSEVYDRLKVPVMMGYSQKFIESIELIKNELIEVITGNIIYIKEFLKTMEHLLETNINGKLGFDKKTILDLRNKINELNIKTDTGNEALKKTTDTKIITDRKLLGEVVNSLDELEVVGKELVKLGDNFRMETLEELEELTDKANLVLNNIYEMIKEKKLEAIDKNSYDVLVKYTDVIARYTTVNGFIYYFYLQMCDMVNASIKILDLYVKDNTAIDKFIYAVTDTFKNLSNKLSKAFF